MPCVKALLRWRKMVGSQQTYDQKGLGKHRNPPKEILHGSKGPFQMHMTQ